MHAVSMGTTTASETPVVVMRRCRMMVFEKPEVVDKLGDALSGTQPLTTLASQTLRV